jgi:hypothetical protein
MLVGEEEAQASVGDQQCLEPWLDAKIGVPCNVDRNGRCSCRGVTQMRMGPGASDSREVQEWQEWKGGKVPGDCSIRAVRFGVAKEIQSGDHGGGMHVPAAGGTHAEPEHNTGHSGASRFWVSRRGC